MNIAVVILTFNEELNLQDCLASVAGLRVFVVDSGSSDRTLEIARAHGAAVVVHPFETHAKQWEWALSNLPIEEAWVLGLDADQRVSSDLRTEMEAAVTTVPQDVQGFYVNRRQVFRGQWIRWGGYYPKYLLKLFLRSAVHFDERDVVDHHFRVRGGVRILRGDLVEANRKEDDITVWIAKHNLYAARQAEAEESGLFRIANEGRFFGTPDERVLALKRIWGSLPLFVRPFVYFGYRYVLRLGVLDGKEGFVFHFLQAFWYRLVIDIKRDELRKAKHRALRRDG